MTERRKASRRERRHQSVRKQTKKETDFVDDVTNATKTRNHERNGCGFWLNRVGIALILTGAAVSIGATLFGIVSGRSRIEAMLTGALFQRRENYTRSGWRFYQTGLALGLAGFLMIVISIYGA